MVVWLCLLHHRWTVANRVETRLDGARGKKQVWCPHVRTWALSEANVPFKKTLAALLGPFGDPAVIRHRAVSRAGLFGSGGFRTWLGPGSDISLSKCFGPISGLHTKLFCNIQSNDFFSFVTYICCIPSGDFCEWSDCDFFQLSLFANTAAFFCSLLGLVSKLFLKRQQPSGN